MDDNKTLIRCDCMQVNTDPWLFADPIDIDLKSAMIAEMFNIVGFHIPQVSILTQKILKYV